MILSINYSNSISCWWVGALLCASLSACSSDTTIHDVEEQHDDVPMQLSQAAINSPVTRADGTSHNLEQGFLVSCWKAFGKAKQQVVMDKYEVKYKQDLWNNSSRWDYVGTKSTSTDGYYQDQYQRYWDASAYAYRFYAITPCPPHDEINSFTLTDKQLVIPETVSFVSQTCENGKCTTGAEPYSVAQVECPDGSNNNDIDLLANGVINKSNDGHTTTLTRYVALPFHHITSKVRFGIYSTNGASFKLSNIKIKAQRALGFITEANGYTADLTTTANMLSGQFTKTTAQLSEYVLLTDGSGTNEFSKYNASSNPYWFQCEKGLLQIPQQDVKLLISFDINGTPYSDIPIAVKSGETTIDSFTWESNKIYTYYINISDLKPLTIEFSAELSPWINVEGAIDTNLEK
jgi:hypothetical protein